MEACRDLCLTAPYRCHSFDYGDTGQRVCRLSHHTSVTLTQIQVTMHNHLFLENDFFNKTNNTIFNIKHWNNHLYSIFLIGAIFGNRGRCRNVRIKLLLQCYYWLPSFRNDRNCSNQQNFQWKSLCKRQSKQLCRWCWQRNWVFD